MREGSGYIYENCGEVRLFFPFRCITSSSWVFHSPLLSTTYLPTSLRICAFSLGVVYDYYLLCCLQGVDNTLSICNHIFVMSAEVTQFVGVIKILNQPTADQYFLPPPQEILHLTYQSTWIYLFTTISFPSLPAETRGLTKTKEYVHLFEIGARC